jgi:ribosomal protein S18 acetylase RimI-like enzyme
MGTTLDQPPPEPAPADGIELRDFVPDQDERAMFDVMEDAFRDNWGGKEGDFERWLQTSQAERSDVGLWHLAVERGSGAIVGGCQGSAASGSGWIRGLGVLPAYRQQGLGRALLLRAFGAFFARDVREVSLSVDAKSATGAPQLYTRAGMRVTQRFLVYRKALLPEGGRVQNAPTGLAQEPT